MASTHDTPRRPPFPVRTRRALRARARVLFSGGLIWQVAVDAALLSISWWLAFFVRFDSGTPIVYERAMFETIAPVVMLKLAVLVGIGIYDKWWRYLSVKDMEEVLRATVGGWLVGLVYLWAVQPAGTASIPRSILVLDLAFSIAALAGVRFLARSIFERPSLRTGRRTNPTGPAVLIVGAGEAGRSILREIQRKSLPFRPVGLLDDDERKQQIRLEGIPVVGTTRDIDEVIDGARIEEVIIAMPSADGAVVQRISEACQRRRVTCRTLPAVHELVTGNYRNLTTKLREVQVEDVLGREPIRVDLQKIADYLTDNTVLVTGAGGSIGSELCRQIARVNPNRLILVDHAENALFLIDKELREEHGIDFAVPVVADAKNRARMERVFAEHRPTVVFHAGAYKHVPMMELNPMEAVQNNAFATRTVCELAIEYGAERFLLVSTDKAVEPQTIMGQSKALAEWVVQSFADTGSRTRFMAVRFGNVLGSNGSVVPIFREQIAKGGPVTVTDPRMTRFFMTIPEAVQLIIQSGSMGEGGEVYVLDMGRPVRIMDLAENMIRLSGHRVGEDIQIRITGIRPGEKLDEVLFAGDEKVETTDHEKIWRARQGYRPDAEQFFRDLDEIQSLVSSGDYEAMAVRLATIMQPRIEAGALDHQHLLV